MTRKEILEKAVTKAIEGGWVAPNHLMEDSGWRSKVFAPTNDIIFNHDFAKALWGVKDEIVWADEQRMETLPNYKYHLQQMVISDDPIKYLGENI